MSRESKRKRVRMLAGLLGLLVSVLLTSSVQAQLVVGGPTANGSLEVRRSSGANDLVFVVEGTLVSVGSNSEDADFRVIDENSDGVALWVNGSASILTIGAETSTDDGDLQVYDGTGDQSLDFDGSDGTLTLGAEGNAGELAMVDASDDISIVLDANSANVTQEIGGEGLIKAWCRVGSGGALLGGFRCSATTYEGGGSFYSADFTALATDISSRGIVFTVNEYGGDQSCAGDVHPSDLSTVRISCTEQVQFIVMIF